MNAKTVKVLVVDDHPLVLNGLTSLLAQLNYHAITANTSEKTLDYLVDNIFDLILLDLNLPDIDGKSLVKIIRLNKVSTPILVVSGEDDTQNILWMLDNGIQGFINKNKPVEEMKKAISQVLNGGTYIPPNIKAAGKRQISTKNNISEYLGITKRQKEILHLIEQGKSNKQISFELGITENTVGTHLKEIFTTLKVHNRTECVKAAKDLGII